MPIYFFHPDEEHGYLSNFSMHGFKLEGVYWKTVEHFYQAQKFIETRFRAQIQEAETPDQAKRLAHTLHEYARSDWEDIRDEIMISAVSQKFIMHRDLRELLLATGDEELIEHSKSDFYWGCGWDGTGENRLGKILMKIRSALKYKDVL